MHISFTAAEPPSKAASPVFLFPLSPEIPSAKPRKRKIMRKEKDHGFAVCDETNEV